MFFLTSYRVYADAGAVLASRHCARSPCLLPSSKREECSLDSLYARRPVLACALLQTTSAPQVVFNTSKRAAVRRG